MPGSIAWRLSWGPLPDAAGMQRCGRHRSSVISPGMNDVPDGAFVFLIFRQIPADVGEIRKMSESQMQIRQDGIPDFRPVFRRIESEANSRPPAGESVFPASALRKLADAGALTAALPVENGGAGLQDSPAGTAALVDLLRRAGRISLSLGRCLEGHINVVRLVSLYGSDRQRACLVEHLLRGTLAGVWMTDGPVPVSFAPAGKSGGGRLEGIKGFASGVQEVGLALITVRSEGEEVVMALVLVGESARMGPGPGHLTGMTASGTGSYDFSGIEVAADAIVGQPGDYLRQPEFSAGAWRASAVALGAMDRLVDLLRKELRARGRAGNPHQQVRIGRALILRETAFMWVKRAAFATCEPEAESGEIAAIVNLARLAVEEAALELITLVQRGLGVAAFVRGRAVEQVMRDLATYLRQPAPDETMTEAAAWFTQHEWPEDRA